MYRLLTAFFLLFVFISESIGQGNQPYPLLKNGSLTAASSLMYHKISHTSWQACRFGEKYFFIVQLNQVADNNQKTMLARRGITLEHWLYNNYYLATGRPGSDIDNPESAGIKNMFALPPGLKTDAGLLNTAAAQKSPKDYIVISCFPSDKKQTTRILQNMGAVVVDTKIKPADTWFVLASVPVIKKIASLAFVYSISAIHMEDVPLNYNNHGLLSVQSLVSTTGRNLTGRNLIVGIGDNADPSTHIDLSGKLIMRTDEPVANHGTHTSGTLAGGGILNPLYTGMAPHAHLVVNDFSNIIVNSPTYVADYNMPLTSNSYFNGAIGCPGDGDYNILSNYVDSQLLGYPKLLHVFAAGNDGGLTCGAYPVNFATIKSGFQTAKNVLTVGAMYYLTNSFWNGTSRGPVSDGRLKPEIVAGGASVVSTFAYNTYGISSGTSMACPTAAGILTLITERYRQLHGGSYPDGALLKTLIVNSADDLGNPGPDFTFGFGKINGRKTAEALEQNHYFNGSVTNGSNQTFTIPSLPAGNYQLKILLYWPDAPALPLPGKTLVNDLDLSVTEPGGLTHLPMILDPSPANVNNNAVEGADHLNNIEQVLVNNPPSGDYTLTVNGNAVPVGPQSFYIAYEIIPNSVTVEYPFGGETWVPGQTETIRWSAYGGDPNTFSIDYSPDGGSSWININSSVPNTSRSFDWVVPAIFTTNALIRVTRNVIGYTDQNHYPVTILQQPGLTVTNTCPGYARLDWNSIPGADAYEILKLSADSFKVIGSSTDTSFLVTPLKKDSSYWFSVRPLRAGVYGRRSVGKQIIPNSGSCATGLNNDLILDSLLAPSTGRQFTSNQNGIQRVSINVRNPGTLPTSGPIDYSFQVNGGTPVTETNATVIPAGSNAVFTFSPANAYDFTAAGSYTIRSWIHYGLDTIPSNDTITYTIRSLVNAPLVLNASFTEGFEQATDQTRTQATVGLDSLDRADFSNSNGNGRLNSFFNSGFARTGKRSILLDVTELGTVAADSLTNTFNLSNYSAADQIWLDLYFKKQSVVPALAANQVWIRGNDQAAWIPVKNLSDPLDAPGQYIKLNIDVTGTLAQASPSQTVSSSFQVRCGSEGKTPAASSDPSALPGGGISFDDFIFTRSQHDVGMRALVQPTLRNVCALGNAEKITVLIRNFSSDTLLNIPVTYAINQDTVIENIGILLPYDSLQYTFIKPADMSVYQVYHIKTWVSSATDNYRNNDSSSDYTIQTTPLISQFPYLEGFENNNGYWYSSGFNSSWQWGKPSKTIIHKAANGTNAWVTSLTGNYNDNEYSFLYSPCFDLTTLTKPVLSFSHIFQTEDDCNCDFHWVEYSLNDSTWTVLGNSTSGVNWYDDAAMEAWQLSNTRWHVSSYDIPVISNKIRFRIVMYSDPGTNYEGVGIDDIHIFDKAPVFTDSLVAGFSQPVSGSGWIDFDENGHRILSINPNGQDLGITKLSMFRDTLSIRDTAGQYYGERNWVVQTSKNPVSVVGVRYYFTDSEANKLIFASGCAACLNMEDAYVSGVTQYSSIPAEEDSSLKNNRVGTYLFHKPQSDVLVIPYDNGYYAETSVLSFSEFWINGGGKNQDHPLAAWLKDFTATASGSSGLLNWTSWQETGAVKYIIERSADSILFNRIGETPAINHLDSTQAYQFTDPKLAGGYNYYRLILLFADGDSLISPVRSLYYSPIPTSVEVFPNPTTADITIKTPSTCREIQIFDALGRKLLDLPAQGYVQQVNLASFSRGVYFLKLFTDSGNKLIKLVKR
jgi:hypothetical protein